MSNHCVTCLGVPMSAQVTLAKLSVPVLSCDEASLMFNGWPL